MADQNTRNNLRLHRILPNLSEQFNAVFINVGFRISNFFRAEQSPAAIFPHAAFSFTILVIIGLLQLKYQGMHTTPFESDPKTIYVAITSLLIYCLAYGIQLGFSSARYYRIASDTVGFCMSLAGSLSIVATASFLFPDSVRPFLFAFCFITSAGVLLYRVYKRFNRIHCQQLFMTIWRLFMTIWRRLDPRCFTEHRQILPL